MKQINPYPKGLDTLQKISVSLMTVLVLLTFIGANLHAILWQQSTWLVSTVLPAVVVELTNAERSELSAPELRRNATLDEAARLKAQHMAANEYFSHYSPTGVSPWHWFSEAGYTYAHAGENLAIHFTDSAEVVEAWMDSPTHRANIINQNYMEIGVGTAKGSFDGFDTVYVVQLFGSPAAVPESVEPIAALEEANQLTQLAEQAEELAELVEALDEPADTTTATEPVEVLAENTVVPLSRPAPDAVLEETFTDVVSSSPEPVASEPAEVLVVESTIATSSGLAVASIQNPPVNKAGAMIASVVTQPNVLLQWAYMVLAMIVMALLLFSAVFEARRLHFAQVAYSVLLMGSMGAFWYIHSLLTTGAVII